MNDKQISIKDDNGDDYMVADIQSFHQHLVDFHAGEGTLHTENGRMFTVTEKFRQAVAKLAGQAK